jgi:hypothetical protein
MLFCVLAISLAIALISTTPAPPNSAKMESSRSQVAPLHALTGVAFRAVSVAF